MSLSLLSQRARRQSIEIRALQALLHDEDWTSENQSSFIPLLAYTLGRISELKYFKGLLSPRQLLGREYAIDSASMLLERYRAREEVSEYVQRQLENILDVFEKSPGEVFEELYDAYDLFFISQALGDQYHERLTQVISEVLTYLESRDGDERGKFERSILNLKSSNLCFSGGHRAFSQNPSRLFSPLLPMSTAAVAQSHNRILNRVLEHYDRDSAESRLMPNCSSVLQKLIELSQQEGEKVIQTIQRFGEVLFEEYESVSFIPSSDEPAPFSSTVIVATTPRYRGQGSPNEVMSSLNKFLSRSKADNLAIFILSNQSGFKKVLDSPYLSRIDSSLRSEGRGILIPLVVKKYQVDFAPINWID